MQTRSKRQALERLHVAPSQNLVTPVTILSKITSYLGASERMRSFARVCHTYLAACKTRLSWENLEEFSASGPPLKLGYSMKYNVAPIHVAFKADGGLRNKTGAWLTKFFRTDSMRRIDISVMTPGIAEFVNACSGLWFVLYDVAEPHGQSEATGLSRLCISKSVNRLVVQNYSDAKIVDRLLTCYPCAKLVWVQQTVRLAELGKLATVVATPTLQLLDAEFDDEDWRDQKLLDFFRASVSNAKFTVAALNNHHGLPVGHALPAGKFKHLKMLEICATLDHHDRYLETIVSRIDKKTQFPALEHLVIKWTETVTVEQATCYATRDEKTFSRLETIVNSISKDIDKLIISHTAFSDQRGQVDAFGFCFRRNSNGLFILDDTVCREMCNTIASLKGSASAYHVWQHRDKLAKESLTEDKTAKMIIDWYRGRATEGMATEGMATALP